MKKAALSFCVVILGLLSLAAGLLSLAAGCSCHRERECDCPRPAPQAAPTIILNIDRAGQPHLLVGEQATAAGHRLLFEHIKARAAHRLTEEGFASVGGERKSLTREAAEKLIGRIGEEDMHRGLAEVGVTVEPEALGDGGGLLKWIGTHMAEIEKVIKWVLRFALKVLPL